MGSVMKKILLSLLVSLTLSAQNPTAFSALGDVIYNDISKFKALGKMDVMADSRAMIDAYIQAAAQSKKIGHVLDENESQINSESYLTGLRTLSTEHDAIIAKARERFEEAMADEDSETINKLIHYGVIDPEDYTNELVHYYEEFGEDQNLSSIEAFYKAHTASLKKDTNQTRSEAQREARENEARIKRMRAKNRAVTEALEKSVEEEKAREKQKVLNEQKKELGL